LTIYLPDGEEAIVIGLRRRDAVKDLHVVDETIVAGCDDRLVLDY
jgi:hypothetical protein